MAQGPVDFYRYPDEDAVTVRYFFTRLTPGDHGWHIHRLGDISNPNGTATAAHFIGDCSDANPCRESGLQEVGAIDDTRPIVANAAGEAYGVFTDAVIDLSGIRSIVGRSVIVHDVAPNTVRRVAQGAIGIAAERFDLPPLEVEVVMSVGAETAAEVELDVESTGSGGASVRYDPNTRIISWTITYEGLTSAVTAAHFHGPAFRFETNQLQAIMHNDEFPSGSTGSLTLTPEQEVDLLDGIWYINVHTALNPRGEIRGQIAEEFAILELEIALTTAAEIQGGTALAAAAAAADAVGMASIVYDPNLRLLQWNITLEGLSGDPTAMHFHGPAGRFETRPVVIPITELVGSASVTEMQEFQILDESWYINIHTAMNPNGELRGQVAAPTERLRSTVFLTTDAVVGDLMTPSLASGIADVTYDPNTGELGWNIEFMNLTGDATSGAFHGPATASETAAVIFNLANAAPISPNFGNEDVDNQMRNDRLLAGDWYIQINTEANPEGELRGQIILEVDEGTEAPTENPIDTDENISAAICVILPTNDDNLANAAGYIMFTRPEGETGVNVTYAIEQIEPGMHSWYIFEYGFLLSLQNGRSVGDPFIGDNTIVRPEAVDTMSDVAGIGALGDGSPINFEQRGGLPTAGDAAGSFIDNFLQFEGPNGIVGRSVGILSLDGSEIDAFCTIGILEENVGPQPETTTETTAAENTTAPAETVGPDGGAAASISVSHLIASISVVLSSAFLL